MAELDELEWDEGPGTEVPGPSLFQVLAASPPRGGLIESYGLRPSGQPRLLSMSNSFFWASIAPAVPAAAVLNLAITWATETSYETLDDAAFRRAATE